MDSDNRLQGIILAIATIWVSIYSLGWTMYWFFHPHFTGMELFRKMWLID